MRYLDMVTEVTNDRIETDPIRAIVWKPFANARRLMKKDPKVEEHVKNVCQLSER